MIAHSYRRYNVGDIDIVRNRRGGAVNGEARCVVIRHATAAEYLAQERAAGRDPNLDYPFEPFFYEVSLD